MNLFLRMHFLTEKVEGYFSRSFNWRSFENLLQLCQKCCRADDKMVTIGQNMEKIGLTCFWAVTHLLQKQMTAQIAV